MKENNSSILNMIGNTPVVELAHLNGSPGVRIIAKMEGTNPKLALIHSILRESQIPTLGTSGNLGAASE